MAHRQICHTVINFVTEKSSHLGDYLTFEWLLYYLLHLGFNGTRRVYLDGLGVMTVTDQQGAVAVYLRKCR